MNTLFPKINVKVGEDTFKSESTIIKFSTFVRVYSDYERKWFDVLVEDSYIVPSLTELLVKYNSFIEKCISVQYCFVIPNNWNELNKERLIVKVSLFQTDEKARIQAKEIFKRNPNLLN